MLRDSVREFGLDRLRKVAEQADADCATPPELLAQANELGLSMVGVPEELGGAVEQRSAVTSVLMSEALAQGDMGIAVACLAPAGVSTAISLWGDADQQSTYLPEFVSENVPSAALALLEPRALFDPFALQTKARKSGQRLHARGRQVARSPRRATARCSSSRAELEGDRARSVHRRVEDGWDQRRARAGDGRARRRHGPADLRERQPALGRRCSAAATRPCTPNASRWPGSPGARWPLGTGQAVLDYVVKYVNERRAFGEPISQRQAVAFTVANIAIELDGMRLATYRAASRVDQNLSFAREAAIARRLCAERGMTIGSDGVQLLGGHGYVKEHPVERWYRDLRAAGLMEGGLLV